MSRKHITFALVALVAFGCLEDYKSEFPFEAQNVLVVDSYLNATTNSIHVLLSYAFDPAQDTISHVETSADVRLEADDGSSIGLTEEQPGRYRATHLAIDKARLYRIHFFTAAGQEFESDYVPVTSTPVIDSVTWKSRAIEEGTEGLDIIINSSGTTDTGLFFFWDFEETWEYTASFFSEYKYENRQPVYRAFDERMYVCYRTDPSKSILLGSTENLTQDIIQNRSLLWIPGESERLSKKYSILVRQRTITQEAHAYWTKVKRTTENLGGLFDPPLTQVTGNIRGVTNRNAAIVGYFSVGEVSEKRMTVLHRDLPDELLRIRHFPICGSESIYYVPLADIGKLNEQQVIVSARYSGPVLLGYYISSPPCSDCRLHGGVLTPPSFWND